VLLEPAVVVGDDLFRGKVAVGGVEAQADLGHSGQVVDPMGGAEPQRRPAMLPRAARSGCPIEHHEVLLGDEFEAAQIVGDRQAGLPGADHHDLHALGTLHHLTISTRVAVYAQYARRPDLHRIARQGLRRAYAMACGGHRLGSDGGAKLTTGLFIIRCAPGEETIPPGLKS
jgi:hypothetical protein